MRATRAAADPVPPDVVAEIAPLFVAVTSVLAETAAVDPEALAALMAALALLLTSAYALAKTPEA